MHRLTALALALMVSGCGATGSSPTDAPSQAASQAAGVEPSTSPDPTASPTSAADPDGTFVFVPGVMDCPGEVGGQCPSTSIAEALAEPGMPGIPLLMDGAILIEPDGSVWLCQRLTEDSPPSCDGARLVFENFELMAPSPEDLEAMALKELDGFRWVNDVTIMGEVTPGT